MSKLANIPTAQTVLKAIAYADGKLRGHPDYLTKLQMIYLAKKILELRYKKKGA